MCCLFLLTVNLYPQRTLGLGENGTFNSKDIVQLPLLINYFKLLSLVTEQFLLRIFVSLHRELSDCSLFKKIFFLLVSGTFI